MLDLIFSKSSDLQTSLPLMSEGFSKSINGRRGARQVVKECGRFIINRFQIPRRSFLRGRLFASSTPDHKFASHFVKAVTSGSIFFFVHLDKFSFRSFTAFGLRSLAKSEFTKPGRLTRWAKAGPTPQKGSATLMELPI